MSARFNRRGVALVDLNATRTAQRAAGMQKVHAQLAGQELSSSAIAAQLGLNTSTVYGYLRQLEEEGYVRKTGAQDAGGRQTWAQDNATRKMDNNHASRARITPARQIGMRRHWLVEALFGPARNVAGPVSTSYSSDSP
jgi:DNA-binding transcriptional regulator YhcF (GntR family)